MAEQVAAHLTTEDRDGTTVLILSGRLDAQAAGHLWRQTLRAAKRAKAMALELTALEYCDMSGAALLVAAEAAHSKPVSLIGASPQTEAMLERARVAAATSRSHRPPPRTRVPPALTL
jgi:anti-anti-sigma factor